MANELSLASSLATTSSNSLMSPDLIAKIMMFSWFSTLKGSVMFVSCDAEMLFPSQNCLLSSF